MKVAKVGAEDEDPEDALARKIVVESRKLHLTKPNMSLVNLLMPKPGNKLVLYCYSGNSLGLFESSYQMVKSLKLL